MEGKRRDFMDINFQSLPSPLPVVHKISFNVGSGLGTLGVNVRSREGNSQTGHRMLTTSPIKSESSHQLHGLSHVVFPELICKIETVHEELVCEREWPSGSEERDSDSSSCPRDHTIT